MLPPAAAPLPPVLHDAVERLSGPRDAGLLIVADHATNRLPANYGSLGLPPSELERHIGYDIGVEALTRALSTSLAAPAVLSRFSRLLIDPNRGEDDPTLVMRLSDGAIVPGNARVDAVERDRRIAGFWRPYHGLVATTLDEMLAVGPAPFIVSLHSYTPFWKGVARPWHCGVLWDADPRLARRLIDALAAEPGIIVGNNEPYDGALKGDSMYRHGTGRGLAHAIIEVRQDLVADASGVAEWAGRLTRILAVLRDESDLHEPRMYPSRADMPRRT